MQSLSGEVAIVTGAASGLGRAIVERFIQEGAHIVAFDRSREKLDALSQAYSGELVTVCGDVRSAADNAAAVQAATDSFGKLDCAIGNAGIWDYSTDLASLAPDRLDTAFDEIFQINVKGYLHLARAALPELVRSRGSIIYTVSNAGFDPAGGGVLYTASKHAVVGLIRQLAYEFAPVVKVNGVAPGPIETDLRGPNALDLGEQSISAIGLTKIAAPNVPLAIVPTPEDYSGAYVLLASRRDNRAMTGAILPLDVGIAVRGIGQPAGGRELEHRFRDPCG